MAFEALWQKDVPEWVKRDRNSPSVVMWSLGNEAGGYHNTDAMYDYLKLRSDLPVHYESAIHCKRIAYDVGSEMYPSVKMVHDAGEHCRKQKRESLLHPLHRKRRARLQPRQPKPRQL